MTTDKIKSQIQRLEDKRREALTAAEAAPTAERFRVCISFATDLDRRLRRLRALRHLSPTEEV
jgi:hypothetical protein